MCDAAHIRRIEGMTQRMRPASALNPVRSAALMTSADGAVSRFALCWWPDCLIRASEIADAVWLQSLSVSCAPVCRSRARQRMRRRARFCLRGSRQSVESHSRLRMEALWLPASDWLFFHQWDRQSQWDRISKLRAIESLVARVSAKSLPGADAFLSLLHISQATATVPWTR